MNERIYKTMTSAGVTSLVLGIVVLCTGVASGVLLILSAARLFKHKGEIMI